MVSGPSRCCARAISTDGLWPVAPLDQPSSAFKAAYTHVLTIDPVTGSQINDVNTGLRVHEYGGAACENWGGGWCQIPHFTTGVNGPCLGWVRGYVDSSKVWHDDEEYSYCYFSASAHELTFDRSYWNAGYVGSFTQAGW